MSESMIGPAINDRLIRFAVPLILLIAALLRLRGIDFGLPAFHDSDEPLFMLMGFHLLEDGTLNPGWFGHPGSTTIYAVALIEIGTYLIGHLAGLFADQKAFANAIYADPSIVVLPVRLFIAACGIWCVWLTWRIGRQAADWRVGLLAAAFLAFNPLHIQYSQIVRTDVQATVFMLLSVLAAIRFMESERRLHLALSALWCGFAIATKWPAATVIIVPVLSALIVSRRHPDRNWMVQWVLLSAFTGGIAIVAMIAASPYLVLDYKTVLFNLTGEARPTHVSVTGHGFWQNLWWYISGPMRESLGGVGLLVAIGGGILAIKDKRLGVVIVALPLIFLVAISTQSLVWPRWILPMLPFLSLMMALAIIRLVSEISVRSPSTPRGLTYGLAALAIILPMGWKGHLEARERANDTRSQASAWADRNIPKGSRIAIEYIGIDLLQKGWTVLFPVGDAGCVDAQAAISGKVQFGKADKMRGGAMVVNLGTIPDAKRHTCAADYAMLVFSDRYQAERARFPVEAAAYDQLMASGTLVKSFKPERGISGGPVVRIVRLGK